MVDVRIHPDRAGMGVYVRAKSPDRGIEKPLGDRGISHHAILELGNLFRDRDDRHTAYRALNRGWAVEHIEGFADRRRARVVF